MAFVPASASRLAIAGVTFLPVKGVRVRPVELHLLWSRDNRNPALHTVLDCLREPE